jgi:hypothetical protein
MILDDTVTSKRRKIQRCKKHCNALRGYPHIWLGDDDVHICEKLPIRQSVVTPDVATLSRTGSCSDAILVTRHKTERNGNIKALSYKKLASLTMLTPKVKDILRNKTNNDLPEGAEPAGLTPLIQQPATAHYLQPAPSTSYPHKPLRRGTSCKWTKYVLAEPEGSTPLVLKCANRHESQPTTVISCISCSGGGGEKSKEITTVLKLPFWCDSEGSNSWDVDNRKSYN